MSETTPPYVLQVATASHGAKLFRRSFAPLVFEEGVASFNGANDLKVSERGAGANMSVDVAKGGAMIKGDDTTDQGMYFAYNDATVNKTIATADPTNPRKDLVVARVKDNQEGQSGDTWLIDVITGTPAGSPVEPTLPATALKLAVVDVPANDTTITNSQITDSRTTADPSVNVWKGGAYVGSEPKVNFTGSAIDVVDNSGAKRVDVTETSGRQKSWNYFKHVGSRYYGPSFYSGPYDADIPISAQTLYAVPVLLVKSHTVDSLAFELRSIYPVGSTLNYTIGLYHDSTSKSGTPGTKASTLVSSSNAVSTGIRTHSISVALDSDKMYWIVYLSPLADISTSVRGAYYFRPISLSGLNVGTSGYFLSSPGITALPDSFPASPLYAGLSSLLFLLRYST